jgi:hypothetical protein
MTARPFAEFRDTPLWHTLAAAVTELEATREITVATAPEYVIGYLCQRLVARHPGAAAAFREDPAP